MIKHYILQAIDSNGKSVFVDDVPNGKNCGCVCKECGGALIAKQGNVKAHHFAHANGNDSIKCSQTALHLLAKAIIAKEKRIPAIINGNIKFVTVEDVEQEKNLVDIKPDLYTVYKDNPVAIEIFVSHPVDDVKFDKIQNHKLTTFEIDLSKLVFETKEDVRKAIYDLNNIKIIYDKTLIDYCIQQKKQILLSNGILKPIQNGIIQQCPMQMQFTIINRRIIRKFGNIRESICKRCFFGFYSDDKKKVHCIGHINQTLPNWYLAADVNENRFLSNTEIQQRLSSFKQ